MDIPQIETSLSICQNLKKQIESECYVDRNVLGGFTLTEYEKIRQTQLSIIKEIYYRLVSLRESIY